MQHVCQFCYSCIVFQNYFYSFLFHLHTKDVRYIFPKCDAKMNPEQTVTKHLVQNIIRFHY